MSDFINTFLLVYAALFPIVNPVGSSPIFLSLTGHNTDPERRVLARKVGLNSFFLLLGATIVGSYVLEFFGITIAVVRIAGGMVVTAFGWRLLHEGAKPKGPDEGRGHVGVEQAFFPLTMPLTVGPGSISVAITIGSRRPPDMQSLANLVSFGCGALLGLAAIAATIYVCFRSAKRIVASLGPHGTNVMVRLSAFILLCIGIEILWAGLRELLRLPG